MKTFAITTLAVVTLTMFAGDARAQGGFFSSLFGLSPRPVSNTSYYGTTYPATNSSYYGTTYPAANCNNGVCTTTQYAPTWNNSGYYGNSTGNGYSNSSPNYYAPGSSTGNWTTPNVLPASYNCPGGYCPQTPTTPYNTTPYAPGHYNVPAYNTPTYHTPSYNNTPTYNAPSYNNAPYHNSY
jgi:hypothetical protein